MKQDSAKQRVLEGQQAAEAAKQLARFVALEPAERPLLVGLASRVGRLPSAPGLLGLTNLRLVFGRSSSLPARLVGQRSELLVLPLDVIDNAACGSRWLSARSGLWGASTLVITVDGRIERFSTYGAKFWRDVLVAELASKRREDT